MEVSIHHLYKNTHIFNITQCRYGGWIGLFTCTGTCLYSFLYFVPIHYVRDQSSIFKGDSNHGVEGYMNIHDVSLFDACQWRLHFSYGLAEDADRILCALALGYLANRITRYMHRKSLCTYKIYGEIRKVWRRQDRWGRPEISSSFEKIWNLFPAKQCSDEMQDGRRTSLRRKTKPWVDGHDFQRGFLCKKQPDAWTVGYRFGTGTGPDRSAGRKPYHLIFLCVRVRVWCCDCDFFVSVT